MPYTTPIHLAAGAVLTAGAWQTNTEDNVVFAVRGAIAYGSMSGSQSVASSTMGTPVTLQINNLQLGGSGDDPTLTSYIMEPVVSGVYRIMAFVTWPANATGQRLTQIVHNGSTLAYDVRQAVAINGGAAALQTTTQYLEAWQTLTAGDDVSIKVAQDSGSSLSVQANTFLAMQLLRP